jgi:hypothetical protein
MLSHGIFVKISSLHSDSLKDCFITITTINNEILLFANCLTSDVQLGNANLLEKMNLITVGILHTLRAGK